MAICSIGDVVEDSETQYGAVYSKSHMVYTIEWGEGFFQGTGDLAQMKFVSCKDAVDHLVDKLLLLGVFAFFILGK